MAACFNFKTYSCKYCYAQHDLDYINASGRRCELGQRVIKKQDGTGGYTIHPLARHCKQHSKSPSALVLKKSKLCIL